MEDAKNEPILYNDIPPTKLTKTKIPFICSDISLFWLKIFDIIVCNLISRSFGSIKIKNLHNFKKRNSEKSSIFYGVHSCWWDGAVGYYLCKIILGTKLRMMIEQLHHFPILAKAGAFSVDKKSLDSIMKSLNYSINILRNPKAALWLFPQGIIKPPEYRPIKFNTGISYICKNLDGVNLFPIAVKYTFLRKDKPEVLIEIGEPIFVEGKDVQKKEFMQFLEENMTNLLDNQQKEISTGKLTNYKTIYKTGPTLSERIQLFFKKI